MKNILTIDLEEWFHANYESDLFDDNRKYEIRVVENTMKLLNTFDRYECKATFFVLGYIAEKHADLVRMIHNRGHEVASHGYNHKLVYKQTKSEFKYDVEKSIFLIENIINTAVKGYRAPSWSITEESLWAWEVLEELGLVYDASVFPIKNFLYGLKISPRFKYNPTYNGRKLKIIEIPTSTIRILNKNIAFSGGAYLRLMPYSIIKYGIKRINKEGQPAIVYLHPREIDVEQPKLDLKFSNHLIHYVGIKGCESKLNKLLREFKFCSIEEYYNL